MLHHHLHHELRDIRLLHVMGFVWYKPVIVWPQDGQVYRILKMSAMLWRSDSSSWGVAVAIGETKGVAIAGKLLR